jgi:hypothetical protein
MLFIASKRSDWVDVIDTRIKRVLQLEEENELKLPVITGDRMYIFVFYYYS